MLFFIISIACKNEAELSYTPLHFKSDICADCPKVEIAIFYFKGNTKIAETINSIVKKEVITQLLYDDAGKTTSIKESINSFKNRYLELKRMYLDENLNWEASIKGTVVYENKDLLTIKLETYVFTGGAHGNSISRFLNFDKKKGDQLENWQLFKDKEAFKNYAEIKFKIQEHISQSASINSSGFMFEDDVFYMPENIGFTEKGLQLLYNTYEIASYADGPISITLPYDELKSYLAIEIKKE